MSGKRAILFVMAVIICFSSSVALASSYSAWSGSYSGVQYQYVNQFGGNDWDGLRWHNGNSVRTEVTYTMKLRDGGITRHLITLGAGETSAVIAVAAGQRVSTIGVKNY